MKQAKNNKWLFVLVFLTLFSCSKDNEVSDSKQLTRENFVGLSLAKEIGTGILFKKTNNSLTNKTSSGIENKIVQTITEVENEKGNTVFYVINYVNGGYIILSADNRMQPIIAFSETGEFIVDESAYSDGLKSWVKGAEMQITAIQGSGIKQTEEEKLAWRQVKNTLAGQSLSAKVPLENCVERTTIDKKGPYLNSTWWQIGGYNDALEEITCNGNKKPAFAGCVPIAMAQVMRYYQYPINYNWSAMPLDKASTTTASFILDIHNAIRNVYPNNNVLSYDCSGTGVNRDTDIGQVLKKEFKYSSADYSDYNYQVVKNNLAAGKPVLLEGFSPGHMWVCDGYQSISYYFDDCTGLSTLYFHMIWGWKDAVGNGYFAYNSFKPLTYNFNSGLKMTYNIKP
jgi:hypothetical protein